MMDHTAKIRAEQVRVIFSQTGTAVIGTFFAAVLLCVIQWNAVALSTMLGWLSYMLAITSARIALNLIKKRNNIPERSYRFWGRWYLSLLLLSGCGWGAAGFVMFPGETDLQSALMALWMIGVSSGGGIGAYLVHIPTVLSFYLPILIPCVLRLFLIGGYFHNALAVALILYAYVILSAGRRLNRSMVKAIRDNLNLEYQMAEREKAEKAMIESHRHLQLITDNIPACIAHVDAEELKYRFVNRRHMENFGFAKEEIIGRRVFDILGPEKFEFAKPYIEKALSGVAASYINQFVLKGELSWVNVNYVPYKNENGQVIGLVVLTHDISESKRLEKQLVEAKEAAEEANRAKSEFLANMSHEIRTPMNAVTGLSHLMLQTDLTPVQKDYQLKIQSSADSLLRLIDDILDLSKIEAGKLEMEKRSFSLDEVTKSVSSVISARAAEKGLDFSLETDESVPGWLHGDALRLRQVLINLASNAVKFTHDGSVSIRVETAEESETDVVLRFTVRDTGIGMSSEQVDSLFHPFYQADASITRKYGGTGLGLAISNRLVNMMDGEFSVESEPGVGSSFSFTARLGRSTEEASLHTPGISTEEAASLLAGNRILLVEDNEINRQVARELLEGIGVSVVEAGDGGQAVDLVASEEFQAVLMDLQMPVMDGFAAARAIRSDLGKKDLPIIAMTANAMAVDRENSLAAGMNDHMAKPIKPGLLYETLIRWIRPNASSGVAPDSLLPHTGHSGGDIEDFSALDGVNPKEGLAHVNGDPLLYWKVLENVFKGYRDAAQRIGEAIDREDWEWAREKIHSLKGVAGTMGAVELSARALDLENSLKSPDGDRIVELYVLLAAEAERVMFGLERLLSSGRHRPNEEMSAGFPEIGDVMDALVNLKQLIEEGDPEASARIARIHNRLGPTEHGAAFRRLESQVENYDFEDALVTLESILAKMNEDDNEMG